MTTNNLRHIRERRAMGAPHLAGLAGVARQTIYAIESGAFVPNTSVALRLAHALDVPVEEIFQLEEKASPEPPIVEAELVDQKTALKQGQPLRLWRVGRRWVASPMSVETPWLDANATLAGRGSLKSIRAQTASPKEVDALSIAVAGCDPAMSILSRFLAASQGVETIAIPSSSSRALQLLKEGKVHVAGMHLRDAKTGEFNLPFARRAFPRGGFRVVTYASWDQGLVVAAGNPRGIRSVKDLAQANVRIMNREKGSGSRDLLDRWLKHDGVDPQDVSGYGDAANGHLAAARAVSGGAADCCVANRLSAAALGLEFIPLATERYDFIVSSQFAATPSGRAFLDVLKRTAIRDELQVIAGYNTAETGLVRV